MSEALAQVRRPVQAVAADGDGVAWGEPLGSAASRDLAAPRPEHGADLMYTSGSRGDPKAAVHMGDKSKVGVSSGERKALTPFSASPYHEQSIPRRGGALPYRLSPLQERLWFMDQLNPELPVYNEADAVRLRGELKVRHWNGLSTRWLRGTRTCGRRSKPQMVYR